MAPFNAVTGRGVDVVIIRQRIDGQRVIALALIAGHDVFAHRGWRHVVVQNFDVGDRRAILVEGPGPCDQFGILAFQREGSQGRLASVEGRLAGIDRHGADRRARRDLQDIVLAAGHAHPVDPVREVADRIAVQLLGRAQEHVTDRAVQIEPVTAVAGAAVHRVGAQAADDDVATAAADDQVGTIAALERDATRGRDLAAGSGTARIGELDRHVCQRTGRLATDAGIGAVLRIGRARKPARIDQESLIVEQTVHAKVAGPNINGDLSVASQIELAEAAQAVRVGDQQLGLAGGGIDLQRFKSLDPGCHRQRIEVASDEEILVRAAVKADAGIDALALAKGVTDGNGIASCAADQRRRGIQKQMGRLGGAQRSDHVQAVLTVDRVVALRRNQRVVARPAQHRVVSGAGTQDVVTILAVQQIVAGAAVQIVIAGIAIDLVIAAAAAQQVTVRAAKYCVIPSATIDRIGPASAKQQIVPGKPQHKIVIRPAVQHVGQFGSTQRIVTRATQTERAVTVIKAVIDNQVQDVVAAATGGNRRIGQHVVGLTQSIAQHPDRVQRDFQSLLTQIDEYRQQLLHDAEHRITDGVDGVFDLLLDRIEQCRDAVLDRLLDLGFQVRQAQDVLQRANGRIDQCGDRAKEIQHRLDRLLHGPEHSGNIVQRIDDVGQHIDVVEGPVDVVQNGGNRVDARSDLGLDPFLHVGRAGWNQRLDIQTHRIQRLFELQNLVLARLETVGEGVHRNLKIIRDVLVFVCVRQRHTQWLRRRCRRPRCRFVVKVTDQEIQEGVQIIIVPGLPGFVEILDQSGDRRDIADQGDDLQRLLQRQDRVDLVFHRVQRVVQQLQLSTGRIRARLGGLGNLAHQRVWNFLHQFEHVFDGAARISQAGNDALGVVQAVAGFLGLIQEVIQQIRDTADCRRGIQDLVKGALALAGRNGRIGIADRKDRIGAREDSGIQFRGFGSKKFSDAAGHENAPKMSTLKVVTASNHARFRTGRQRLWVCRKIVPWPCGRPNRVNPLF